LALHAAIAWSVFQSSRQPYWLALGMLYLAGKYIFMIQSLSSLGVQSETRSDGKTAFQTECAPSLDAERKRPKPLTDRMSGLARAARRFSSAVGHADLRWHLWIALALFGRLDLALAVYAVYFPLRAIAGVSTKAVAHA
jgi:hypothetical protein